MANKMKPSSLNKITDYKNLSGNEFFPVYLTGENFSITLDVLKKYIGVSGGGTAYVDFTSIDSNVIPDTDNTRILGNTNKSWKSLTLGDALFFKKGDEVVSLQFGTSATLKVNGSLEIDGGLTIGEYSLSSLLDDKQNRISDLNTIRSNSQLGAEANSWGNHSEAGYATTSFVNQKVASKQNKLTAGNGVIINNNNNISLRLGTAEESVFDPQKGTSLVEVYGGGLEFNNAGELRIKVGEGLAISEAGYLVNTREAGNNITVVNSLTSNSETSALSAKQGNVLKGLIDNVEGAIPTKESDLTADRGYVTKTSADGYYLGKTAKAADSAKLGGIAASEFVLSSELPVVPSLDDYYTGAQVDSKINALKNDILGGASGAYDTLKEIETILEKNKGEIGSLLTVIDEYSSKFQGQIDGLWSRNSFEELILGHAAADTIAVGEMTVDKINGYESITPENVEGYIRYSDGISFSSTLGAYLDTTWLNARYATVGQVGGLDNRLTILEGNSVHIHSFQALEGTVNGHTTTINEIQTALGGKADKSSLSDYYTKYELSNVATTGSYDDLINKPEIPSLDDVLKKNDSALTGTGLVWSAGYLRVDGDIIENASEGNTAYGWGNHAAAGYAKSSDLDSYLKKTSLSFGTGLNNDNFSVAVNTDVIATKSWVQDENYLKGITSEQVTSALGFTPQDIITAGDGISFSSNIVSVDNTIARASALANYLPLNGSTRTIKSTANTSLILKTDGWHSLLECQNNHGNIVSVGYYSGQGARLYNNGNYLSVKDDGTPTYNGNTLIHSGNIGSQTVAKSNALVNSDGTVILQGGELKKSLTHYAPNSGAAAVGLRYYTSVGTSLCGIGAYSTNDEFTRMYMGWGTSPWESANCFSVSDTSIKYKGYDIIHSNNIGSQSVSAADKLSTARTIWGQSFDGSGNVSGDLSGVGSITRSFEYAVDSDIAGNLKFKRNDSTWSILSSSGSYYLTVTASSGDVGIGTTNPQAKLDVNGSSNFIGNVQIYETDTKQRLTLNNYSNVGRIYVYNEETATYGDLSLGINDESTFIIKGNNGNVGIGTTGPVRKLHINDTSGIPAVLQSNQPSTALGFSQKDGGTAYITYSGGNNWKVTNNNWGAEYRIIHAGNYEEYTVHINAFEGALARLTQVENITTTNKTSIEDLGYVVSELELDYRNNKEALQGQIGSLWARNSFDELYATHVMSDTLAVEEMFTDKLTIGNAPIEYVANEGLKLSTAIYIDGSSVALTNQLPTTTQKNNWNTAYSWGNHASVGYTKLKSKDGYTFLSVTGGVESEAGWALRIGTDFFLSSVQSAVYADYYSGSVYLGTPNYRWLSVYALSYDQSSDATLKDVVGDTSLTLSQIANAPAVSFTWKYNGKKDVGTLAQYWKDVLPEIVSGEEGNMGMNYAALGVVSSIILARNIETHEQRIERLERENEELRKEILTLKNR